MSQRTHTQSGFALPAAIFTLVIMALMVTGGFYLARQESRIGVASQNGQQAFYLAEQALGEVVESWDASVMGALPTLGMDTLTGSTADGNWAVEVTKASDRSYLLRSRGEITSGGPLLNGATRETAMMVKLVSAEISPPAALTTQGNVSVRGGAQVTGMDTNPPEWGGICEPALNHKPGVLTDAGSSVTTQGSSTVDGYPFAWDDDPSINDLTFTVFGDLTWEDLIDMATVRVTGGSINGTAPVLTGDGRCDTSDNTNWGDPLNPNAPCGSYFPIIYSAGSATIQSNGFGQGILLVDGDLDLRGTFIFHGIIITRGSFETQGSGHRIMGGVMARNADLDLERIVGSSIVQNSSCAVERAILLNDALTRVRPLGERSWMDVSNLAN